jgi:P4 family phage/plasmid primase-like protien
MQPHNPLDYITKVTAVGPDGGCPLWHKFLDRVTGGDVALKAYLQRVAGYCCTGYTHEQVMFFLYGTGANGKGVFVNTLAGVLGDYAVTAPLDTFVVSKGDRHPTELAGLRGARLVVVSELEKGARWAEAKIKALTGDEKISARFMHQNFFEFTVTFKIMISGNHKPSLSAVNEAVRRRFHLIPFSVTIPPAERDKHLFENLKPEWPGILKWMCEGCFEWQEKGLAPPKVVTDATEAYLNEEDALALWIEECCDTDNRNYWETSARLWGSWRVWAERRNEIVGSQKSLGRALDEIGYRPKTSQNIRGYEGIRLKPSAEPRERADLNG